MRWANVEAELLGGEKLGYRPELDGLRAIAVLSVIGYHYWTGPRPFSGGWIGVDLFFVLSGFLITRLLLEERAADNKICLARFYVRRVARLLPALCVLCSLVMADAFTHEWLGTRRDSILSIVYSLTYVNNWNVVANGDNALGHTWSLSVEEQFYLLWPIAVVVVMHRSGFRALRTTTAILFSMGVVNWLVRYNVLGADGLTLSLSTDTRGVIGLLSGCFLATVVSTHEPIGSQWIGRVAIALWLPVAFALTAFVVFSGHEADWPNQWGYPLIVIGIALILVRTLDPSGLRLLRLQPVVWIGRLSYGLYLYHRGIGTYVRGRFPTEGLSQTEYALISLTFSFIAATASYYLVEQPARRWLLGRWARRESLALTRA